MPKFHTQLTLKCFTFTSLAGKQKVGVMPENRDNRQPIVPSLRVISGAFALSYFSYNMAIATMP